MNTPVSYIVAECGYLFILAGVQIYYNWQQRKTMKTYQESIADLNDFWGRMLTQSGNEHLEAMRVLKAQYEQEHAEKPDTYHGPG